MSPGCREPASWPTPLWWLQVRECPHSTQTMFMFLGNNANTIHYIASTSAVSPSEFVLMDAGCEYHGYASDITRTWPASGQFSDGQLSVYQAVLDTQQRLIANIVTGVTTIDGLYKDMQVVAVDKTLKWYLMISFRTSLGEICRALG